FDGKTIARMHDLPRIVAASPVGKDVDVVVVRKGSEQTAHVKLGRLEDEEALAAEDGEDNAPDESGPPAEVDHAEVLGMSLAGLDDAARTRFEIAQGVSGVVVTQVAENSQAADKGVVAG